MEIEFAAADFAPEPGDGEGRCRPVEQILLFRRRAVGGDMRFHILAVEAAGDEPDELRGEVVAVRDKSVDAPAVQRHRHDAAGQVFDDLRFARGGPGDDDLAAGPDEDAVVDGVHRDVSGRKVIQLQQIVREFIKLLHPARAGVPHRERQSAAAGRDAEDEAVPSVESPPADRTLLPRPAVTREAVAGVERSEFVDIQGGKFAVQNLRPLSAVHFERIDLLLFEQPEKRGGRGVRRGLRIICRKRPGAAERDRSGNSLLLLP